MRHMRPTELRDYLAVAEPAPLLLDVREPWEYQIAHLEGTLLVPMREVPGKLHELDPERETVVICHHGIRSFQICQFLERCGFRNVVNLSGGVSAWVREADPSMRDY
jgi:rhodanese-related sulfurtransferase